MRPYFILIPLVLFVLSACSLRSESGNLSAAPDVSLTLTTSPYPDLPPTMTPYVSVATRTPVPTVPPPAATGTIPAPTPIPDPALHALAPLPATALQVQAGYQERWYTYLLPHETQTETFPLPGALVVLDIETGTSWEVTRACTEFVCEFAWLSTGQLLWLENGNVWVADANGENRQALNAPEDIRDLFGVSAANVAILRGSTSLYRFFLSDGSFDPLPAPQPATGAAPDFVSHHDSLAFTADGRMAGLAYEITGGAPHTDTLILAIPLEKGAAPRLLAESPALVSPEFGQAAPLLPPVPLPGTPYWMPLQTQYEQGLYGEYLIEVPQGTFRSWSEVAGFSSSTRTHSAVLSPDRTWVTFVLETEDNPPVAYVAPVADPSAGITFTGTVLGWQTNPPAIVVAPKGKETGDVYSLSLTDGTRTTLFDGGQGITDVRVSDTALFAAPDGFEPFLNAVSTDGTIHRTAITPYPMDGAGFQVRLVHAFGNHLYFIGGNPTDPSDPDTKYLWRWDLPSPRLSLHAIAPLRGKW